MPYVDSPETRMHGLIASALFSAVLLAAALGPGLPSQLVGQASAGEPDQVAPVESTQSPPASPSKGAASVASICDALAAAAGENDLRSEEHTSELQSLRHLVCRLLLEKKNSKSS